MHFAALTDQTRQALLAARADVANRAGIPRYRVPFARAARAIIETAPLQAELASAARTGGMSGYAGWHAYTRTAAARELTREGRGQGIPARESRSRGRWA